MRQSSSTTQSIIQPPVRLVAATQDDQHLLLRGVMNGIFLSVIIWTIAGYLTFILR